MPCFFTPSAEKFELVCLLFKFVKNVVPLYVMCDIINQNNFELKQDIIKHLYYYIVYLGSGVPAVLRSVPFGKRVGYPVFSV